MVRDGRRLGIDQGIVEQINILRLCEHYHCLPSELRAERAGDVESMLTLLECDKEKNNREKI